MAGDLISKEELEEKLDLLNNRFMFFLMDLGVDLKKNPMASCEVADMFSEIFDVDIKPVDPTLDD